MNAKEMENCRTAVTLPLGVCLPLPRGDLPLTLLSAVHCPMECNSPAATTPSRGTTATTGATFTVALCVIVSWYRFQSPFFQPKQHKSSLALIIVPRLVALSLSFPSSLFHTLLRLLIWAQSVVPLSVSLCCCLQCISISFCFFSFAMYFYLICLRSLTSTSTSNTLCLTKIDLSRLFSKRRHLVLFSVTHTVDIVSTLTSYSSFTATTFLSFSSSTFYILFPLFYSLDLFCLNF